MEYEAIDEGMLAKIVVPEGTADVPVNQLIAVLADGRRGREGRGGGRRARAPRPPAQTRACQKAAALPASDGAAKPAPPAAAPAASAAQPAAGAGSRPTAPTASSPRRWRGGWRRKPASTSAAFRAPARTAASSRATSRRRSRARGSLAPAARRGRHAAAVQAPSDDKIRALFEAGSYEVVPHDNMRKVIARRLVEAKLTIPHFYLTLDCDIGKLLAAREEINAAAPKDKDGKPAYKISVNDFVIKALALALQRVPDANVTWTEGGMLKHKHSDIGVAVVDPGRADHAGRAPRRDEVAVGHLQRDEGLRRARAGAQAQARGISGRHRARCPTSACTASRISPPSSTRRTRPSWRSAPARSARSCKNGKIEAAMDDVGDALDRPPRRRRRARRRAARRVQGADRKSGDDGGVETCSRWTARRRSATGGSHAADQEVGPQCLSNENAPRGC